MLKVSDTAVLSPLADLEESQHGTAIVIGDHTVVDSFVKIKPAGGAGDVIIGARSYLNSGVVVYSANGVLIGDDVLIAANCTIAAVNHEFKDAALAIREQGFRPSKGGIVIEDDVWIGANSVLLDGAHVETGAIVAAGTVVRGRLESGGIYAGNPARLIGRRW